MPDRRRHRGPHPEDAALFGPEQVEGLRAAVRDLRWLLDAGYPLTASLALVGNRFELTARQRIAVSRSSATTAAIEQRRARVVDDAALSGATVWIDGFNVITTVEAALSGGVLLLANDGTTRDMASMHGSYRKVEETERALESLADRVTACGVAACRWLLDAPVSNSGRLKTAIRSVAEARGLDWEVDVIPDPDGELIASAGDAVVATADARILDGVRRVWHLAGETVAALDIETWCVDLRVRGHR